MLEMLLSIGCVFGSTDGCEKTIQAYGQYSGIDKDVQKIGIKYPVLSHTMSVAAIMKEQKVVIPLIYSNLLFSSEVENKDYVKNQVIWRMGF